MCERLQEIDEMGEGQKWKQKINLRKKLKNLTTNSSVPRINQYSKTIINKNDCSH